MTACRCKGVCGTQHNTSLAFRQFRHVIRDHRSFEEVGIHVGPKSGGVGENEIAKILFRDHTIVNQFVGLLGDFPHVRHVPMADVRAEYRAQSPVVRILLRIERPRVDRIVCLATEVEVPQKKTRNIGRLRDPSLLEVVERRGILGSRAGKGVDAEHRVAPHVGRIQLVADKIAAVAMAEIQEHLAIEVGRVVVLHSGAITLLPVTDEIAIQAASPSDSAFEEPELEFRKAPRHAGKEKSLAQPFAGRGEVADVVVHVVIDRRAKAQSLGARMKGRRDFQFDALGPYRVVIVSAVEAERVEPVSMVGRIGGDRPRHVTGHHDRLHPQVVDRILQLLDRLLRPYASECMRLASCDLSIRGRSSSDIC